MALMELMGQTVTLVAAGAFTTVAFLALVGISTRLRLPRIVPLIGTALLMLLLVTLYSDRF